jgi:hypothetical protein
MHLRIYRALLALYPRSFRREYREPMLQLFGDCVRDRGARVWLRTVPDLVRTLPALRLEAVMSGGNTTNRVVVLVLAVLAVAAVALGVGGPALVLPLLVAIVAMLVLGRGSLGPVFNGERAPLRHAVVQTWWAPLAALLGAAMLFFGFGTIFEAHNWGGRIFGTATLLGFGFGMFLGLTRRPFSRSSGNALILITTTPALVFFWVVIPTVIAFVIWIGVFTSGWDDAPVAPAAP